MRGCVDMTGCVDGVNRHLVGVKGSRERICWCERVSWCERVMREGELVGMCKRGCS